MFAKDATLFIGQRQWPLFPYLGVAALAKSFQRIRYQFLAAFGSFGLGGQNQIQFALGKFFFELDLSSGDQLYLNARKDIPKFSQNPWNMRI